MKIVLIRSLINPKSGFIDQPQMPPLSIYYLGAILKKEGFEVDIIDPYYYGYKLADQMFLGTVLADIDVICISTTTFQWRFYC